MAGLAKTTYKTDNPSTYLRCLDFRNKPTEPLLDNRLKHCLITLGVITEKACDLIQTTELDIYTTCAVDVWSFETGPSICIMSGTVKKWQESCINAAKEDSEILKIICQCIIILEGSGFKELFQKYKKKNITEDKFILIPK